MSQDTQPIPSSIQQHTTDIAPAAAVPTPSHKQYIITKIFVAFIAFLHVFFLVLEMFLWNTPFGRQITGFPEAFAAMTTVLAANQGLYNGFLALGLIWSIFSKQFYFELQIFFLGCIVMAGIYGAATGSLAILGIQATPALIVLLIVLFERFLVPLIRKRWALRKERQMKSAGDENSNTRLLSTNESESDYYGIKQENV